MNLTLDNAKFQPNEPENVRRPKLALMLDELRAAAAITGDPTIVALAAFNTNGFLVQTATDTFAGRTLTAPAAGFTIANPAGTAGNPTFALADDLAALEGLGSTGIAVRTGANAWAQRTITSTDITVTNGGGVAGDIALTLATVNANVGTFGSSSEVAQVTVNGKGLVTAAAAVAITPGAIGAAASSISLTAGAGLTGGGDLTANRTFTVGAGTGITVNADDITIATNGVADTMLRDSAALSVIGRSVNSSGDPGDIAAGTDGHVLRRSGSALDFGTVATAGIADDAVTYAKMQNVSATDKLLGRSSSGAGDVEEIACTAAGRALIDDADANAQRQTLRSGCMVQKSSNQTAINASAGNYLGITWETETYDDDSYHDPADNTKLFTKSGQTRVRVGCTIAFANVAASSQISVALYVNGSSTHYAGRPVFGQTSPSATIQPTMTLASGPIPVTGGTDYFQVALFCSDTSVDVTTSSSFWIEAC